MKALASDESTRGQASVEVIGGTVALLFTALIGFQLLGAGYAAVMAGHAAEAAALAVANGHDARGAAARAVPGWPAHALDVRRSGGRVRVTLRPPSLFHLLDGRLAISEQAAVRTPGGR